VPDKDHDLDSQLDDMLSNPNPNALGDSSTVDLREDLDMGGEADDAGDEILGDMETVEQATSHDDDASDNEPTGASDDADDDPLADQIQQMIDEASAEDEQEADAEAKSKSEASDEADEDKAPRAEADTEEQPEPQAKTPEAPEQTIEQIDDQLAESADGELVGDFETVEAVAADTNASKPEADQSEPVAEAAPPAGQNIAEDEEEPGDDDELEGQMQSVDEALDDMLEGQMQTVDQVNGDDDSSEADDTADTRADAEDDDQAPTDPDAEADAAAVAAAELDADEAMTRRPDPQANDDQDDNHDDDDSDGDTRAESDDQPAKSSDEFAEQKPALDRAASQADNTPRGPNAVVKLLATINAPLLALPATFRDFVGFVGLTLLFWAACLFAGAAGGMLTALIVGAVAMPALLAAFYFMFVRQPSENGDHHSTA